MKFTLSNIKFLKSWGFFVFTFLVVFRVVLWLSMEWPPNGGHLENPVVKIHNLPIRFMVFWPDSERYWPSTPPEKSLSILKSSPNIQNHLQHLFFLPIRLISDNPSHGVLAQNIISLMSAWMLFMILRSHGNVFASIVVFISFANLFTISMEYALLREVLSRFLLISLLYLLWRMFISPSWNLALATGIILFLLPFGRQEMIIITVVTTPVVFWRLSPRYAIVITLMGFLAAFTMIAWPKIYDGANIEGNVVNETYNHIPLFRLANIEGNVVNETSSDKDIKSSGKIGDKEPLIYVLLLGSLLTDSYNYNSPVLKDLPKRIYDKAMLCKSMFKIDCQMPSIRYQHFEDVRRDVIKEWTKENGIDYEGGGMADRVYWDILENNTKYAVYSAGYSLWSYLTSNLVTVSPLIYAGDNPNYKFGWPYYASPRLTSFNDPLSEVSLYERAPKWLLITLSPFSEYWVRRICAPFFLIGLFYIIGRMFFLKREFLPPAERVFWLLTALWVITILLVESFIGWRLSRYVFSIDPFIFAISVLGAETVWKTFLNREISVKKKRLVQLVLLFLLIIIIGIPIYSRYNLSTLKRFIVEKRAKNATPENPVAKYTFPLVNPSFEIWHVNNIPERWSYAQSGSGGSVYKEVDIRNIKFGSSSARVTRSNAGASQLYYTLSDEDARQLSGKNILFGGWIKSQNTVSDKISLSVTSLYIGQYAPSSYYQNTGEWEFVYFWYHVPNDTKAFNLYFDINSNANADAYFDGAIMVLR